MRQSERVMELGWVFRPMEDRPADIRLLAGIGVYAVGAHEQDGEVPVVLVDGTRLVARPGEIVAERYA